MLIQIRLALGMPNDSGTDFMREIQPLATLFQKIHNAQTLLKVAKVHRWDIFLKDGIKGVLTLMSKWGMPKIMRKRNRLRQVLIEAQRTRNGTADLSHFQRVGQACTVVVLFRVQKDLRLVLETAEGI